MAPTGLKEKLKEIFTKLEEINNGEHVIMIDGEYDSNCTKFEGLSNDGEIGVECNNLQVGYSLLFLLRIIIDDNYDYLNDVINDPQWIIDNGFTDDDDIPMDMMKVLSLLETEYTDIFQDHEKIVLHLISGKKNIKRSDIDLWDIKRIKTYFYLKFDL
jgi:hypothetical protein